MKKLVLASTALCLLASSAFAAAPTAARAPKVAPKVGSGVGSSAITAPKVSVTAPAVSTGVGSGAAVQNNAVVQAAMDSAADIGLCNNGEFMALANSVKNGVALAQAAGLTTNVCLKDFAGDQQATQTASSAVLAAKTSLEGLGYSHVNQLKTDAERAIILNAMATAIANELGISQKDALARLESTVKNNCDVISKVVGTASAFRSAYAAI